VFWCQSIIDGDVLAGLTHRASKVLQLASQAAHRLNHDYLGSEHLLLGLVKEHFGLASRALRNGGLTLSAARQKVEKFFPARPPSIIAGSLTRTADAEDTIERAKALASEFNHIQAGTGHFLLALLTSSEDAVGLRAAPSIRSDVVDMLTRTNWTEVEDFRNIEGSAPCPELVRSR